MLASFRPDEIYNHGLQSESTWSTSVTARSSIARRAWCQSPRRQARHEESGSISSSSVLAGRAVERRRDSGGRAARRAPFVFVTGGTFKCISGSQRAVSHVAAGSAGCSMLCEGLLGPCGPNTPNFRSARHAARVQSYVSALSAGEVDYLPVASAGPPAKAQTACRHLLLTLHDMCRQKARVCAR